MEFLFLWLLFGIICAVIAGNKGRSKFNWFLIGTLIGPFGLILALVANKNVAVLEKSLMNSGESKKCPHCAELVKLEAIKCRYCGEPLTESSNPIPSIMNNNQQEPVIPQPMVERKDS
jgi:hypothetical protein